MTLGLGIGANTAIFSVIDGVLLKPLPHTNGEHLVIVRQSAPLAGRADAGVAIKELYTYREQARAFVAIGLAIGAAASAALARALSAYLFDTAPTDPATFVAVSFVFAAAVACAGPAWRATTVDPMQALPAK